MTIVVVAPHPDDEAIGCGGAIRLHAQRGDRVVVVFLTSGELGLKHLPRDEACRIREDEANRAAEILGVNQLHFLRRPEWFLSDCSDAVAKELSAVLASESPNKVYVPHTLESHPDHQISMPILRQAIPMSEIPLPLVLNYEVMTPLSRYDEVVNTTSVMRAKRRALRCYESQLAEFHYDRAIRGLNQYRGLTAGHCRYAEVFRYREAKS